MSQVILPSLPPVGTDAYKKLDFKVQLEIAALKLFTPEEYIRRTGDDVLLLNRTSFPEFNFIVPSNEGVPPQEDLPVAFLKKYWAGYTSVFDEKWYIHRQGSRGCTPLDQYGMSHGYLVNVRTFNFSLMSLDPGIMTILNWMGSITNSTDQSTESILDACKIYAFMSMTPDEKLPRKFNPKTMKMEIDPFAVYAMSSIMYEEADTFEELNDEFPMIEPCEELDLFTLGDYVIFNKARRLGRSFYFPLVPSELYQADRFKIFDWGFIDKK